MIHRVYFFEQCCLGTFPFRIGNKCMPGYFRSVMGSVSSSGCQLMATLPKVVQQHCSKSCPETLLNKLYHQHNDCKQLNTTEASKDHFKLLCLHLILKSTPIIFNSLSIASNMQVNSAPELLSMLLMLL